MEIIMAYFTSNKRFQKRNYNIPKVTYKEITMYERRIKNRIKSNRRLDRKMKTKIQEDVDMIVYLLEHYNVSNFKPNTINNLIRRVENLVEDIPGIEVDTLSEHKIGTLTVG